MVQAPAPNRPQGCTWVGRLALALTLAAAVPSAGRSQAPPPGDPQPTKDAAAPAEAPQADEAAVVDPANVAKPAPVEVYRDPRAEQFLDYERFPELPRPRSPLISDRDERQIQAMAAGAARVDERAIRSYVEALAYALSDHSNLKALVDPNPDRNVNSAVFEAISRASNRLVTPLTVGNGRPEAGDTEFRRAYVKALKEFLPKLLGGHLISRTEAMIALGMAGDPDLVSIYLDQLKDPNQVTMVKLWAARGLARTTLEGKRDLDLRRAIEAGSVLADYLEREGDAPWFAQVRALEALGALRQAAVDPLRGSAEMATVALRRLADPQVNPSVRAWAGWALGMMRPPTQMGKYNFGLIAYHLGRAAADIGERVVEAHSSNPDQAAYLTSLLGYQILPAFRGESGVRDSGLLNVQHPNLAPNRKIVTEIANRVDAVVVAAIALQRSPAARSDQDRKALSARVDDLRAFLLKNPPADRHLVPGGPEFPGGNPQVAGKDGA